jgi:hypothetical protein
LRKKGTPRKNLIRFNVKGPVPGFKKEIDLWTSAVHESQALLQVQKRLEKKYKVPVYLGGCTITREERR